jgi:predicted nucleic acid-binding protein
LLVLDTDHVSVLGVPSSAGTALLERIGASHEEVGTTIITVEEQLRGWLAEIHRLGDPHGQIVAYERLHTRNSADFAKVPDLRFGNWLE